MPTHVVAHRDIVEEILSRVPVKCLLRFKCVSKSWNSWISSSSFARLHLKRALRTNILISTPSCLNLLDYETSFGDEIHLDFPPKREGHRVRIMGSCHGLIAVALERNKDFFIWNPLTGDYKKLPYPCFPWDINKLVDNSFFPSSQDSFFPSSQDSFLNGFGYDSSTDDYKLFFSWKKSWWFPLKTCKDMMTVVIFSLRKNSWRMIQSPPTNLRLFPHQNLSGLFVNGTIHWLSGGRQTEEILAFDLKTERFSSLPVPNKGNMTLMILNMGVLHGRLCLTFYNFEFYLNQPPSSYPVEIWVMKEYGVKESWTKLLTIGDKYNFYYLPLCTSKGKEFILINEEKDLIRSDAEESVLEKFRICKCGPENSNYSSKYEHPCQAIVYAESLLSPNVNIIEDEDQNQGRIRKRKNML